MRKLICILFLLPFLNAKAQRSNSFINNSLVREQQLAYISLVEARTSTNIIISKDTVVNTTWVIPTGTILKFETGGHISGTGTINGGIIDAALTQDIFSPTLTLVNMQIYGKDFSVMWFGAKSTNPDNFLAIQTSINTCMSNRIRNCFIPRGTYHYNTSLTIQSFYVSYYAAASIHLYGESEFWDARTTLYFDNPNGYMALGVQVGKGTEIDHLQIIGQFQSPTTNGAEYYNTPLSSYGTSTVSYGLIIDYDGSKTSSGSTGCKIHDMWITNFQILYAVSPNAVTANGEILKFENIRCGDARIGFQSNQAQEKDNSIKGIYSWGRLHTMIQIGQSGKFQAGNYHIDGGNVANLTIRLFDIRESGWYPSHISNIYSESIGTVGTITCGDSKNNLPTKIDNCIFHFAPPSAVGNLVLLTSNNPVIKFEDCLFRYYGGSDAMIMNGTATFENCFFSGVVNNLAPSNGGFRIQN